MEKMEARSKDNSLLLVNVCLDYSGKWDIAQSCMMVMQKHHMDSILDEASIDDARVESIMDGSPYSTNINCRNQCKS